MTIRTNIKKYSLLVVLGLSTTTVYANNVIDNSTLAEKLNLQKRSELINFEIINSKHNMCLTPKRKVGDIGIKVEFKTCDNNELQQWSLSKKNKVVHKALNKCLVTLGKNKKLILWSCNTKKYLRGGMVNYITFPDKPVVARNETCTQLTSVNNTAKAFDYDCKKANKSNGWLVRVIHSDS